MNHKVRSILLILVILFFICVGMLLYMSVQEPGNIVVIVQNGEIIKTFDLSKEPNCTFTIESDDGGQNTICVENGTIYMLSADCPDQTCVHMGILHSEATPIVCLPHKLLIRFGEGRADS